MIGAKAARILTTQAHHEEITKTKAEEWLEENSNFLNFQIKQVAKSGEDKFVFFVPKEYLSYVSDYLVNKLGYGFQALGRNPDEQTQIRVRISW